MPQAAETHQQIATQLAGQPPTRSHGLISAPGRRGMLLAGVFALALIAGSIARAAYRDTLYVLDDFDFLVQLGLVATGKLPFWSYLKAIHGPHPMVAFKLLFYLEWLAYGLRPPLFRLTMNAIQALSSVAVFLILLRYLKYPLAALFGALCFSAVAIGGLENPLLMLMCGYISFSILWLLLAMVCVTKARSPHSTWWAAAMSVCTALALLSWGNTIALLPIVPVQYLWLERQTVASRRSVAGWLSAWSLPYLVFGAMQVFLVLPQIGTPERRRAFSPLDIAQRIGAQLSVAIGTLTHGHVVKPEDESLLIKSLVAAIVATAVFILLRGNRLRLVLLLFAAVLVNLVFVNLGGAAIAFRSAVSSGRYLYIPILAWCIAAAALVDALLDRTARSLWRRLTAGVILAAVFVLFVFHQRSVAEYARTHFNIVAKESLEQLHYQTDLLDQLAAAARKRQQQVQIADLPVVLSNPSNLLWPTSAFAIVCAPDTLVWIEPVPLDRLEPKQLERAMAPIRELGTGSAQVWARFLKSASADYNAVLWLDRFAEDRNITLRLPDFWFHYENLRYPAYQCAAWGFSHPLAHLSFVPREQFKPEDLNELIQPLQDNADPMAQAWVRLLKQLLPTAGVRSRPRRVSTTE